MYRGICDEHDNLRLRTWGPGVIDWQVVIRPGKVEIRDGRRLVAKVNRKVDAQLLVLAPRMLAACIQARYLLRAWPDKATERCYRQLDNLIGLAEAAEAAEATKKAKTKEPVEMRRWNAWG